MVNMENYEEYMMLQADGELDEAGCEALQAFLDSHPELADEMKLFESLHLEPDTAMVYAGKEALMQPVPAKRTIALGWRSMAAAASVAAVIGIAAWMYLHSGTKTGGETGPVAKVTPVTNNTTQTITNPVVSTTADTQKQTVPQQVINNIAAVKKSSYKPQSHENTPVPQQDQLAALQPLPTQPLNANPAGATEITGSAPEVRLAAVKEEKQDRHFLAWLPLPEEKKQGLIMVKNAIDERVEQVREINNSIKETTLVLNIGKKGITLNF